MSFLHLTAINDIYKYDLDKAIKNINSKLADIEWYLKYEKNIFLGNCYNKYFLSFESKENRYVRHLAFRINNKQYDNCNTIINNKNIIYSDMADNFLIIEKIKDNLSKGLILAERSCDIDDKTYKYLCNILKKELYKIGIILKNKKIVQPYHKLNDLNKKI